MLYQENLWALYLPMWMNYVLLPIALILILGFVFRVKKIRRKTIERKVLIFIGLLVVSQDMLSVLVAGTFDNQIIPMIIAYSMGIPLVIYLLIYVFKTIHNFRMNVEKANGVMREIIIEAKDSAVRLAAGAEELASTSEEVSASSENIASSQQQISRGASDQVVGISNAQKQFQDLSAGIQTIRAQVNEIGEISDLITSISNQTNMLALNAAIEAARAGEAGRGFNVVAEQVRKLAEESKRSVQRTDEILEKILQISSNQESKSLEIVKIVDSIATVAEETSASTEESAAAAEEQAASMEAVSSTIQNFTELSQNLLNLVSKFNPDD